MEIENRTIALLIDADNISKDYFATLLDELSKYGRVTYRRLYGDFSKPKANGWQTALLEHSIEQIQQVAYTSGKNASDSAMIIDAMDILYKDKVDCFCLATSDSDFTGLAMRFRNDNLIVIGAGEKKTPSSFRKACDRFIPIDELLKAKTGGQEQSQEVISTEKKATVNNVAKKQTPAIKKDTGTDAEREKKLDKFVDMAKKMIEDKAESDGYMNFSVLIRQIYRKMNDFNPTLYGHTNSSPSSFFKSLKNKNGKAIFELKKIGSVDHIKINV
ncbi:MAG: NYN domain-containing protein [Firmicutes bacterium]|nr:NYN domain-containing protein [Bacillota bacterium]